MVFSLSYSRQPLSTKNASISSSSSTTTTGSTSPSSKIAITTATRKSSSSILSTKFIVNFVLFTTATLVNRVTAQPPECLQLTGSTTCPAFQSQYINPLNLSSEYPFLSSVIDVSTFDYSFSNYLETPSGFAASKYESDLQCGSIDPSFKLQYARTFLCGVFTQSAYSAGCYPEDANHSRVCQSTCLQMATDEQNLISNTTACPVPATSQGLEYRRGNITADQQSCTDWDAVTTNNTATCVLGSTNEPNCGFGTDTTRLCDMCDPSRADLDPCCALPNSNIQSLCGFSVDPDDVSTPPEASLSSTPSTLIPYTPTDWETPGISEDGQEVAHESLSNAQVAGVVVGSVLGGILIFAFIAVGIALCWKRKKNQQQKYNGDGSSNDSSTTRGGRGGGFMARNFGKSGNSESGGHHRYESSMGAAAVAPAPTRSRRRPPPLKTTRNSTSRSAKDKEKSGDLDLPLSSAVTTSPLTPPSSATHLVSPTTKHHLATTDSAPVSSSAPSPTAPTAPPPVISATAPTATATTTTNNNSNSNSSPSEGYGSSSDGRNVVPSQRDQYTDGTIVPGSEVIALYPYSPNLADELRLEPETVIQVRKIFDDGWAVGHIIRPADPQNPPTQLDGAFPLVVVSLEPPPGQAEELLSNSEETEEDKFRRPNTSDGTATHASFDTARSHAPDPSSPSVEAHSESNWLAFSTSRQQ